MRSSRLAGLFFVALLVLAGAILLMRDVPVATPGKLAEPGVRVNATTDAEQPQRTVAAAAPRPDVAANLRKNFERTSNYAAFIHDALSRPDEGGRFYAYIAYVRCQQVESIAVNPAAPASGPPANRIAALANMEELKSRCAGVKEMFPDFSAFARLLKSVNAKTPDAFLGNEIFRSGKTPQDQDAELARAIASNDPYFIAATLDKNVAHYGPKIDAAFAHGENFDILASAAGAASCEIAGICIGSYLVSGPCLVAGQCQHTDYRDFVRAGLDEQSRPLYDKATKALLGMAGR